MKKEMTICGVGLKFTFFSVLYLILVFVINYVWHPLFVIQSIPYALLVSFGLTLIVIGIPIWVTAARTIDRAFDEGY